MQKMETYLKVKKKKLNYIQLITLKNKKKKITVSFVDPTYGIIPWRKKYQNDGHTTMYGSDYLLTEQLLKEVYEALRSSPQWDNLLFIVTFDESGGFPDHVAPPINVPRPDFITGDNGFLFDRLGSRVPTIMISPWIQKGRIVKRNEHVATAGEFEHISISTTLFKLFGIQESLSQRSDWALTFEFLFKELNSSRLDCPLLL
ncbi:hypothetical protein HDU92_005575 [Lobulomyces angularis]|nr:hypothetical protein HDU92_005575 [Lobulomyces angularis]